MYRAKKKPVIVIFTVMAILAIGLLGWTVLPALVSIVAGPVGIFMGICIIGVLIFGLVKIAQLIGRK